MLIAVVKPRKKNMRGLYNKNPSIEVFLSVLRVQPYWKKPLKNVSKGAVKLVVV